MNYFELADFLVIAENVLGVPAEALVRFAQLIPLAESALAAPRAGYGGVELYRDFEMKAAVLCSRLARNHPLPDGNKRTAYLCLLEFLARNGYAWRSPGVEETVEMMERVAAGSVAEADFAAWIRSNYVAH